MSAVFTRLAVAVGLVGADFFGVTFGATGFFAAGFGAVRLVVLVAIGDNLKRSSELSQKDSEQIRLNLIHDVRAFVRRISQEHRTPDSLRRLPTDRRGWYGSWCEG